LSKRQLRFRRRLSNLVGNRDCYGQPEKTANNQNKAASAAFFMSALRQAIFRLRTIPVLKNNTNYMIKNELSAI
jgi:hypothetical protein